jgi:recombination associated protein RdgC
MLFSNATVIKLSAPIAADLDSILNDAPFEGVSKYARSGIGWCPLIETESATMTRAYGQRVLFCGRREEKVIPASAVKEEVTARVLKQETLDGQPLSSSAKRSIKDDVLAEMLPRALCKSKRIQIYHDPEQSALILNSGLESEVEDLLNLLRTSIGTLNVYRWDASASIGLFTQWLTHKSLPDQ